MKKFALMFNTNGSIIVKNDENGFFEKTWKLANTSGRPFPAEDYIVRETATSIYRYSKSDYERFSDKIEKYFGKAL